ncbi:MAG TPA: glycosyltransferase family 4 protein, partial [Roseivirga sp.]
NTEANGLWGKVKTAAHIRNSKKSANEVERILIEFKPDIVHVHNLFPMVTPSIFNVCQDFKVPVVQTLHNFRLLCVNTLFFRSGEICEDCLTKSYREGIKHGCYNNSKLQSAIMTDAIQHHFQKGTWLNKVDRFICLTEFAQEKFIQGGLPKAKLVLKPNFVRRAIDEINYEDFFLYAGKLVPEKGLDDFLELAASLPDEKFIVAGYINDDSIFDNYSNVTYKGELNRSELLKLMACCKAVLFLSKMYEGMPMTIIEAFAHSKAVIARKRGAMQVMISENINGQLFDDIQSLKAIVGSFNMTKAKEFGANGYDEYVSKYSEEAAYSNLMNIYNGTIPES